MMFYKRARNEHIATFIPSKEMFYEDFQASRDVSHDLIMRISFRIWSSWEWIIATSFQALGTNVAPFVHENYILFFEKHIFEVTML